jgi:hypothetical protein
MRVMRVLGVLLATLAMSDIARADYPDKTIRIVVPVYARAASTTRSAGIVAQNVHRRLGRLGGGGKPGPVAAR